MQHHHSHDHRHHGQDLSKKLVVSIVINIFITLAQAIAGLMVGSLSLLSDALHNFSDVISLIISYFANILTRKEANERQTYGFKRAEIMGAFINASTLFGVALLLMVESVRRFYNPVVIESKTVMILAFLSVLLNGLCVVILHKDSKDNMNIRSSYLHLFTDMITSVAVLFGGWIMYSYQVYWVDSVITILMAIYLISSSWGLLKETMQVLMQFSPSHISLNEVTQDVSQIPGVLNLHHVHLWQLNDHNIHFEAHLELDENLSLKEVSSLLHKIEVLLKEKYQIAHVTLQPEAQNDANACHDKNILSCK